jgi:CRISPR-associated endoribonuclease Cas6
MDADESGALLDAVALAAHKIRSTPVDLEPGLRIGFTGHATITLNAAGTATPDTARTFAALSRFAQIAGVGAQTTHGLGWATIHLDTRVGGRAEPATLRGRK